MYFRFILINLYKWYFNSILEVIIFELFVRICNLIGSFIVFIKIYNLIFKDESSLFFLFSGSKMYYVDKSFWDIELMLYIICFKIEV